MKKMTCRQLGGACDKEFSAATFEEISEQSKQHGIEMYKLADNAHFEAMKQMQNLCKDPSDYQKWFQQKRAEFNAL